MSKFNILLATIYFVFRDLSLYPEQVFPNHPYNVPSPPVFLEACVSFFHLPSVQHDSPTAIYVT